MGATTVREVLASRSACCVGAGITDGDARSLVPRPDGGSLSCAARPTDDRSPMEGRIGPSSRIVWRLSP